MATWAIIPVKTLRDSKSRLSHILSPDERAQLTSRLLIRTLQVLHDSQHIYRSLVISRDTAALKLARQHGAYTFYESEQNGLNEAVSRAVQVAYMHGATQTLIVPTDLPFVSTDDVHLLLSASHTYQNNPHVILCPDYREEGTNALLLAPPLGFTFQYGINSFSRHLQESARLNRLSRIITTPGCRFDLDTEKDWTTYQIIQRHPSYRSNGWWQLPHF